MHRVCEHTYSAPPARINCDNAAELYCTAVRFGGDQAFFG
ncbi:hypothetical protein ALMP_61680 [Streptomyces sp. A012304]|nr:hypothetical protein ALMP_61680 [Streptomyces sp. A012304]